MWTYPANRARAQSPNPRNFLFFWAQKKKLKITVPVEPTRSLLSQLSCPPDTTADAFTRIIMTGIEDRNIVGIHHDRVSNVRTVLSPQQSLPLTSFFLSL